MIIARLETSSGQALDTFRNEDETVTNFDQHYDRSHSNAEKWDTSAMQEHFGRDDLLPFWVADMEFQAPPTVREALVKRAENGIYGYEYRPESFFNAITQWYTNHHRWKIDESELCISHSVMSAISVLINQHTDKGDGIIVQPPVFFEFRLAILENKRKLVRNPLKKTTHGYEIDFVDLEKQAAKPRTKMLILCSPHNPVGRVWTKEELQRIGEICYKHNVRVIADEIHADIIYKGYQHTPYAMAVSEEIAQQSFTCISPAKTFNIASVTESIVVIPDENYRAQFKHFSSKYALGKVNAFSVIAMETAYRTGEQWLAECLDYLQSNLDFLRDYLQQHIPNVKLVEPEGTFLVWLDFTGLNMDAKELESFLAKKAGVALNSGYWFGRQGAGYARMTIACPRSMLKQGLSQVAQAIHSLPDTATSSKGDIDS